MSAVELKLLGILGRSFGSSHRIGASRPSEALSYLRYNYPEFERTILDLDRQGCKFALVLKTPTSTLLIDDPAGLDLSWEGRDRDGDRQDRDFPLATLPDSILILAPVPAAAGDVGKFLLGAGLLAVSAFLPGTIGIFGAQISTSTLGLYGAGLILGSVINWLTPRPQENKSSIISPTVNNGQGRRIPIGYGRRFVSPQVISGGSQIEDLSESRTRGSGGFLGIFGGWSESYTYARSRAKLQIVDALCEGKIFGFATSDERSIWINGVPIKNNQGGWNYRGINNMNARWGEFTDSALASPWDKVLAETTVNQQLKQSIGPITRRIDRSRAAGVDGVRIRLYWDRCLRTNDGDNAAAWTAHRISVKEGNGSWQVRQETNDYIWNTGSFEREYYISLGQADYYEIKVERTRPDDDNEGKTYSTAYWKGYTTVTNAKLRYPNTVKVGLEIDLEAFGATELDRYYDLKLTEILIPDNATVRADGSLSYSGLWSGNFTRAWSSDPAWCLYDLISNPRYGCEVPDSYLDKFAFYACSQYCSALISDGYGGTEPRFSLNTLISEPEAAYSVIQKLCNAFNAIAYYEAGQIVPNTDKPQTPIHQFNNSNATFSYIGTAYRRRRNRAVVKYTRPEIPNSTDFEIYQDKADILKRGTETLEIDATSYCTSRGQARRIGAWAIYTEQRQKESITIQTGYEGAMVRPGDLIAVGDRDRAGLRRWGRIKSATISSVELDYPLNLPAGSYEVMLSPPDGESVMRSITSISGSTVYFSPTLPNPPEPQSSWLVSGADLQPVQYRAISKTEVETHRYEILGLLHEPSKYGAIEQGLNFVEPPRAVQIPSPPLPPQNLVLTPYYGINLSLGIAWDAPNPSTYTTGYQVEYWTLGGAHTIVTTTAPSYLIPSVDYGTWYVQVRAIDTNNNYSGWLFDEIEFSIDTYFATCYLGDLIATEFATIYEPDRVPLEFIGTTNPTPDAAAITNFNSTGIIEIQLQTAFASTEYIVLLN